MKEHRWACKSCDWSGLNSQIPTANNPFDEEEVIAGCPNCHAIDDFALLCDEPGCEQEATSGWPTGKDDDEWGGYRQTCHKHTQLKFEPPQS